MMTAAPKFRLANASCDERRVELQLGLCDMKGYMTTNLGNQSSYLIAEGKKVRNSGKYLADPVGVVILLETSDHYAIALKRPADAAESAGNIDLPGGFPEPGDCGLALNKVEVVGTPAPEGHGGNNATTSKLNSKDTFDPSKYISLVRNEIFDTVQRQAEQEVNLSSDSVATPILLGAIRNKKTQGRIGLCFYGKQNTKVIFAVGFQLISSLRCGLCTRTAKCNVTADEVRRRYSMLGLEYNFSTSLLTIPFNQILHTNTNEPSIALGGCLELLSARSIHEKVEAAKPKEPKDDQTPEVYKQQGSRGRRRSVPDASEFEEPFTGTVWTVSMTLGIWSMILS